MSYESMEGLSRDLEIEVVNSAIVTLKTALVENILSNIAIGNNLQNRSDFEVHWQSIDEFSNFSAIPFIPDDTSSSLIRKHLIVNYPNLPDFSNAWRITSIDTNPITGNLLVDEFRVTKDSPIKRTTYDIDYSVIEDRDITALQDTLNQELSTQNRLGYNSPTIQDYATLENMIRDLSNRTDRLKVINSALATETFVRRVKVVGSIIDGID